MTKLVSLFFLITASLVATKVGAQTVTLQECIRLALAQNQQLLNAELDILSADAKVKEAKSALLPTVDVVGQSLYYKDLPSQYAPASAFGGPEGQYTKMTLNMKQTTTGTLQLTQNIFNKSAIAGVQTAKVAQEASTIQEEVVRESLVYNVTATFYTIQVLNDNLARLSDNIRNLEKTTDVNKVLQANDLVPENVYHRMQINLENLRNQYESQKLLADNNVTTLKHLIGIPVDQPLSVPPFDYTEVLISEDSFDIARRPDIRLQQVQIKLSQIEKKTIAAGYLPVLTNKFSYGYTAYYDEFGPGRQINNDWITSSYFALTLQIPVFDGFRKRSQIRQKEIRIRQHVNSLSMMRSNADKEVEDAKENYRTNKTLMLSSKKTLDLADQLFLSAQSEYENGLTSLTEFLNAQTDLSNARTNYNSALLNLKLAELSLQKANGTLLRE